MTETKDIVKELAEVAEALEPFAARLTQPGANNVPDDEPVHTFMKDYRAAGKALTKLQREIKKITDEILPGMDDSEVPGYEERFIPALNRKIKAEAALERFYNPRICPVTIKLPDNVKIAIGGMENGEKAMITLYMEGKLAYDYYLEPVEDTEIGDIKAAVFVHGPSIAELPVKYPKTYEYWKIIADWFECEIIGIVLDENTPIEELEPTVKHLTNGNTYTIKKREQKLI